MQPPLLCSGSNSPAHTQLMMVTIIMYVLYLPDVAKMVELAT